MPLFNLHLLFFLLLGVKSFYEAKPTVMRRTCTLGILCVWLLGSMSWALRAWQDYARYCPKGLEALMPLDVKSRFLHEALFTGAVLSEPLLVEGRLSQGAFPTRLLWSNGRRVWKVADNEIVASPKEEGFLLLLLKKPAEAKSLIVPQMDDGGWRVHEDGKTVAALGERFLDIPISQNLTSLSVERKQSVWRWLVILMWVPVAWLLISLGRSYE